MTTIANHDALLAAELRAIVEHYLDGPVPEALLRDLAGFTSGYAARQVEERAHSPASQQGPGRQQPDKTATTRRRTA